MLASAIGWVVLGAIAAAGGGDAPREVLCDATGGGIAPSSLSLDLNIPAYRLDLSIGGERLWTFRVAVGMPRYPTPVGGYDITEITWNPWWIPPESEWARGEVPTPPGPANPMGRVKLQFRPLVFIHGSPLEESLGTAASHACVRMANDDAIRLARLIHGYASPPIAEASIDSLLADPDRTRRIVLDAPVPLRVRYDVVELRDDSLLIHPDIYHRAPGVYEAVLEILHRTGYEPGELDLARIRALVSRGRDERVAAAIGSLSTRPGGILERAMTASDTLSGGGAR